MDSDLNEAYFFRNYQSLFSSLSTSICQQLKSLWISLLFDLLYGIFWHLIRNVKNQESRFSLIEEGPCSFIDKKCFPFLVQFCLERKRKEIIEVWNAINKISELTISQKHIQLFTREFSIRDWRDGAPIFLFVVFLLVGTKLVGRFNPTHIFNIVGYSFWTRIRMERTVALFPLDLDDLWAVKVRRKSKRLSSFHMKKLNCSGLTTKIGLIHPPKVWFVYRHDRLPHSSFKNRSNRIDPLLVEFIQKGNFRNLVIKGHYVSKISQGQTKIED